MNDYKKYHEAQANRFILKLDAYQTSIYNQYLQSKLNDLKQTLQDLKTSQYYFDSDEIDLTRLYSQYLPLLDTILEQYLKFQEAGAYEKTALLTGKIFAMISRLQTTIQNIKDLLPEDEIAEAKASAQARKQKQLLNEKYKNHG